MGCPATCTLGDNLVFSVCTHDPDTGVLTDADSVPTYRVYEDETGAAILTGSMAKLDDANTTGFYTELIAVTAGNGFEDGKSYTVYIEATVDSDKGGICYAFKVYAKDATDVDTAVAALNDLSAAEAEAAADAALATYDGPTDAEMDAGQATLAGLIAALNDLTAAQVNAEVDAALNTAIPGAPTAGSVNERVKAMDVLTEASGAGDLAAILGDTNAVQGKLPSKNYLRGTADADGGMDAEDKADTEAEATDALNAYDAPTKAEMDAGFAALENLSAAEAEAAADAALATYDPPTDAELDAALAALLAAMNDLSAAEAEAACDAALATYDAPTKAEIDAGLAGLNDPAADDIADAVLKRDWTAVAGEASRSVLNALRFLRNKRSVAGATLTVTEEDDATEAWTATITTDAAAEPVTAVDPD